MAALLAVAQPAAATGSIECVSPDGEARVELGLGSLPVLAVVRATIVAGEKMYSAGGDAEDEPLVVGQQFRDARSIRVDFTDPNVEHVVVELRLLEAGEGRDHAMAGTLRVAQAGAWPITCVGP